MTLACCWLDRSFGQKKITALADARASIEVGGKWIPQTEATTKLHKVPVSCFRMAGFNPGVGGWSDPYYATEIGIAFSGACFEAMSIIALYQRFVGRLVAFSEDLSAQPRPEANKLVDILIAVIDSWCDAGKLVFSVDFLLFGFSPQDGSPWCAHVQLLKGHKATLANYSGPLEEESVYFIGDGICGRSSLDDLEKTRRSIRKQRRSISKGKDSETSFESELESARLDVADRKYVEQLVLDQIDSEEKATVGGVMQKLEIFGTDGHRGVASFSRDTTDFPVDALPWAGDELAYLPIVQEMGRVDAKFPWPEELEPHALVDHIGSPLPPGVEWS